MKSMSGGCSAYLRTASYNSLGCRLSSGGSGGSPGSPLGRLVWVNGDWLNYNGTPNYIMHENSSLHMFYSSFLVSSRNALLPNLLAYHVGVFK